MKVEGIFSTLRTTLAGLSSQMKRLATISENIANAQRSPDEENKVYQRKAVVETFKGRRPQRGFAEQMALSLRKSNPKHISGGSRLGFSSRHVSDNDHEVKIVEIEGEKLIYDPSHPMADEKGYVKMPNVDIVQEMVEMISTSRAFEANVSVLNAAKQMAKRALEI